MGHPDAFHSLSRLPVLGRQPVARHHRRRRRRGHDHVRDRCDRSDHRLECVRSGRHQRAAPHPPRGSPELRRAPEPAGRTARRTEHHPGPDQHAPAGGWVWTEVVALNLLSDPECPRPGRALPRHHRSQACRARAPRERRAVPLARAERVRSPRDHRPRGEDDLPLAVARTDPRPPALVVARRPRRRARASRRPRRAPRHAEGSCAATPGMWARVRCRQRHADGSWRWFEHVLTNMFDVPAVQGVVSNSRDTTDAEAAVEAVRRTSERFRALVRHSSDVIIVVDSNARPTYVSPAIEHVLGYRAGAISSDAVSSTSFTPRTARYAPRTSRPSSAIHRASTRSRCEDGTPTVAGAGSRC